MLWADRILAEIKTTFTAKIAAGEPLIIRDEKTMSGRPHIGSLRSASLHATLSDALTAEGIANTYFYELNDTDALDGVPHYVPAEFAEHLGKRLMDVPSPSGKFANYAMEMADDYARVMREAGFPVQFYWQSENYLAGKFDNLIRTALDHADKIRTIYREVSGSRKDADWLPVQVICENCGKIATTKTSDWNGETVAYECVSHHEFTGCGHAGRRAPFGGVGTLPWKVEWPAKWSILNVDIEGAGKDHYAAGGSRMVSNRIADEVFARPHPFDIRHEFILVGGAKMSSSKGAGATAAAVAAMLPTHIFRFMLIQKEILKTIDFSPEGDTIPLLFDAYDGAMRAFYDPATKLPDLARAFELTHISGFVPQPPLLALPKFSQIVFLCQMPHVNISARAAEIKGAALNETEEKELAVRVDYARRWLAELAPPAYRFVLGDYAAQYPLSAAEKTIIQEVYEYMCARPAATGHDLQTFLHDLKNRLGLEPKQIFQPFYQILLGRESGPQLGFMLSALPHAETLAILGQVATSTDGQ